MKTPEVTISCHRKYAIVTNFLDTMLEHSVVIQQGETKLDAYRRGLKELDQIAATLRKEHESITGQFVANTNLQKLTENYYPPKPAIIDKSIERLEIQIDNANTLEELDQIILSYDKLPSEIMEQIKVKKNQLTHGLKEDKGGN